MNAIDIQNLSFRYAGTKQDALQDISLAIPKGQICAVLGRAGAGKSTLCALTSGFVPNFYDGKLSGTAHVMGQDVIARPIGELIRYVSLVGSNAFSQISGARYTVFEEIAFGLENLGIARDEMRERTEWALTAMKIDYLRDRSPYELSGGQQQRMVIAAALALRPPVIILDEPTAQLDPPTIHELAELLRELAAQRTTILFAEHRLEWTADLAQRVIVLDQGKLILDGEPRSILTDRLMRERQIGWPRPASMGERARAAGFWPNDQPLPVTLDQLVEGLQGVGNPIETQDIASQPHDVVPPTLHDPVASGGEGGAQPARSFQQQEGLTPASSALSQKNSHDRSSLSTQPSSVIEAQNTGVIVQVEQVRFSYPSGVEALKGVSLRIGHGERVALLGRNGAGKSTLVRHMNGLLKPSMGQVLVGGMDTRKTRVARCARHVGIVFQNIRNQLFARTVREEVRFGPRNLGYNQERTEQLVQQALEALQLSDVAEEHPYDLPAPRRRLVAVATALAMDVDLLLLDEPTAGLDNPGIELLSQLIHALPARGKSVLVVSHDIDFCFENLQRIVLIQDGLLSLDSMAAQLSDEQRRLLDQQVGLPVNEQAIERLHAPGGSALARLLRQEEAV